jgi:DNA repair protein RecO (recombination protein O)
MSRQSRRVQLAPAYILHHRPYRETSRILEVLTREHGRLTLFARGVRGPKSKLAAALQPFSPLLVSWSGRGEAAQLTAAELAGESNPLPPAALMSAFYLSELVLKLTVRHDGLLPIFDAYHSALIVLKQGAASAPVLRIFEKRLLEALGFGLDLSGLDARAHYQFRPLEGVRETSADHPDCLAGYSLLELASEKLETARALDDSRRLLRLAIDHCLEGRPLATRGVARAVLKEARA